MPPDQDPRLAVALLGIEPATYVHCSLIREWLDDLGVERVTLCVIPAADHHPFFQRSPALTAWLHERRERGDAIAQQGFARRPRPIDWWVAAGALRAGSLRRVGVVRVDVHPDDFDAHPRRTRALEGTLRRAADRCRSVTFDELAGQATSLRPDVPRVLRAP